MFYSESKSFSSHILDRTVQYVNFTLKQGKLDKMFSLFEPDSVRFRRSNQQLLHGIRDESIHKTEKNME